MFIPRLLTSSYRESSVLVESNSELTDLQEQSRRARVIRTQIHQQMRRLSELASSPGFSTSNLGKVAIVSIILLVLTAFI